MSWFILSGHVADVAIAILIAETVALIIWARRSGRTLPNGLIGNAGSGVCLLFALRGALTGAGAGWIALWLTLGFVFHLADIAIRLRVRGGAPHR